METLSAKVIGELVAANERAVSIVPADIAEELVRIAGVGIVRHRFGWTLPPITLFERKAGVLRGGGFDALHEGFDLGLATDRKFAQLAEAGLHRLLLGLGGLLGLALDGERGAEFVKGLGELGFIAL